MLSHFLTSPKLSSSARNFLLASVQAICRYCASSEPDSSSSSWGSCKTQHRNQSQKSQTLRNHRLTEICGPGWFLKGRSYSCHRWSKNNVTSQGPSQRGAAPQKTASCSCSAPASRHRLSPLAAEATRPLLPFCSLLSPSIWPWTPPVSFCCSAQTQIVFSTGTQKCNSTGYSHLFFK